MRRRFVRTSSVIRADAGYRRALTQNQILLIEGDSGLGKTDWSLQLASDAGRAVVRVRLTALMSPRTGLFTIENGLAKEHEGREPRAWHEQSPFTLYLQIRRLLESGRRPTTLVIDEADYLVARAAMERLLHVLRDLVDEAAGGLTLILISIASLSQKLAVPASGLLQAVASRIAERVQFTAPSLDDALLIANELLEDVCVKPDLIADILKRGDGSLRTLLPRLGELEAVGRAAKLQTLDLPTYRNLTAPPAPPRRVATAAPIVKKVVAA